MKKLLVLAVVCALAAPVFAKAETANVNVYGTLNMALELVKQSAPREGEPLTGRARLSSYSSNLGFKGSEELSAGLKGIFQYETEIEVGQGTLQTSMRNTGLGVDGALGKLIFGKWDIPFKSSLSFIDPFYGSAGWNNAYNLLQVRQENSINYWSPLFAGVGAQLYFAPKSQTNNFAYDDKYGAALSYNEGPINAAFAYNRDNTGNDAAEATRKPYNTGIGLAAAYTLMETTTLGAGWATYSAVSDNVANKKQKQNSLMFSVAHKMGDITLRGAFAKMGEPSFEGYTEAETTGTASAPAIAANGYDVLKGDKRGYNQMSFGAGYNFSKRTEAYVTYSRVNNDENANANFRTNPFGLGGEFDGIGADPMLIAFGVKHTF